MKNALLGIIFILISIVITSCTNSEKEDNSGELNQACKINNICNDGLACVENKCISKDEACKNITCISIEDGFTHGVCVVENSKAVCDCNDGYKTVEEKKCELSDEQDLCKADTCNTEYGYVCIIEDGKSKCICPVKYKETEGHDMCILDEEEVCKDIKCDLNKNMTGFCRATLTETGIETSCECERGWVGETCEQKEQDCDKSLCLNDPNATGECYIDVSDPNKETICICNDGYEIDDNTSKCVLSEQ
jgi:hypothetical protein